MTAADRLMWLDTYGVRVKLSPDTQRLDVIGPEAIVQAAAPAIRQHRDELLSYLRTAEALNPSTSF